jgi:radical SAM-linked protein
MIRARIHYSKTELLKWTGNLDMQRIWERLLRRASFPLAYSQGFHPQPRMNQACPLALGFTSQAEMIDIWLEIDQPATEIEQTLRQFAQPGLEIRQVEIVDLRLPSLPTQVISSVYNVSYMESNSLETAAEAVADLVSAPQIERTWRQKPYDLRPRIEELTLKPESTFENNQWVMRLSARESATGRPEEVVSALGLNPHAARYHRVSLILKP